MELSISQFRALMPALPEERAGLYLAPLNAALSEFQINTAERIAAFIAQIGHESAGLRFWRELWKPTDQQKRYDPPGKLAESLGNTERGDGRKYCGRGPIQLTGRANYAKFGQMLNIDLIQWPELLEQPEHGFRAAALYWQTNGLNELADANSEAGLRQITRRINGGYNGWDDRLERWRTARNVLQGEKE